jgi:hypothetical protein
MTLQEIIDASRRRMGNFEVPYWWIDTELVAYANAVYNDIALQTRQFIDSGSTTYRVSAVDGTADYALSANIIHINRVLIGDNELAKRTKAEKDQEYPDWRDATEAEPTQYVLDYKKGYITLWPCPDTSYTVDCDVMTWPTTALTTTSMSGQTPAFYSQFHMVMVAGICGYAFLKQGPHTYDPEKSKLNFDLYRQGVEQMKRWLLLYWKNDQTMAPKRGCM